MIVGPIDREIFHHCDAGVAQDALLRVLVHPERRAQHARSHVCDPRQLEQPLHGAVLAVGAVQHREHHVELWNRILRARYVAARAVGRHRNQRLSFRMRQQRHLRAAGVERGKMRCLFGEQLERVALEIPAAVAADPDWNNLVARRIHRRHHGQRGAQRNFMLARASSKQDAHPQPLFFCHRDRRAARFDREDSDTPRPQVRVSSPHAVGKLSRGDGSAVLSRWQGQRPPTAGGLNIGCRGHPCRRKCETHRGFHIQSSVFPPHPCYCR